MATNRGTIIGKRLALNATTYTREADTQTGQSSLSDRSWRCGRRTSVAEGSALVLGEDAGTLQGTLHTSLVRPLLSSPCWQLVSLAFEDAALESHSRFFLMRTCSRCVPHQGKKKRGIEARDSARATVCEDGGDGDVDGDGSEGSWSVRSLDFVTDEYGEKVFQSQYERTLRMLV